MKILFLQRAPLLAALLAAFCAISGSASAQVATEEAAQNMQQRETIADKLHRDYHFGEAIGIYKELLKDSTDHIAIGNKLVNSMNGSAMLGYAILPRCKEKQKCSINGFFLKFPGFAEKSWRRMPGAIMGVQTPFSYLHMPEGAKRLIFSAPDENGVWNLYSTTHLKDTLWSAPELLNNAVVSSGNEVFPYLSADGKSLYFSSNGLFGAGGYDIYVSRWDYSANEWGTPQNLGFPYSSPADDFLFQTTPDGKYAYFASNRETGRDSLYIYKVEHDLFPARRAITEQEAYDYNAEMLHTTPEGFFTTMEIGDAPHLALEAPIKKIDYTFTIDKENPTAPITDLSEFPNYLVYQVHLLTLTKPASEKNLKGVSPVFERYSAQAKRYYYYAGLFNTYTEAAAALQRVKKSGFPSASVVAYNGGKKINVTSARAMEKKGVNFVYKVIIEGYTGAMPAPLIKIIQNNTTKDIAKTIVNGNPVYVIGPFAKEGEAEKLATELKAVSTGKVTVQRDEKR